MKLMKIKRKKEKMTEEIADFAKRHKGKRFPSEASEPTDEKKSGDLGGYNLGSRDPESDKLAKKHLRHVTGNRAGNKEHVFKGGTKDSLDDEKNKRLKGHGRNEKGDSVYESANCPVCGATNCSGHSDKSKKGKKLLIDKSKLREETLANQIALDYLAKRLEERDIISGVHSAGCYKPDYTGGMEINRTPDAEVQTDSKPVVSKSSKTKKVGADEKKKIKEEILDELSQEVKNKYVTAAKRDIYAKQGAVYHPKDYETQSDKEKNLKAQSNRRTGIQKASGIKEAEGLDEISAMTLASPSNKDNYLTKTQYSDNPKHRAGAELARKKLMGMHSGAITKAKVAATEAGKKKSN